MGTRDLSLRQPQNFYKRYIEDFDNLDEGPGFIEILPGPATRHDHTFRNLGYFIRLARKQGLLCRLEYKYNGFDRLDLCWPAPRVVGDQRKSVPWMELALEQEWVYKDVPKDFSKLIKIPAYLKVLICGGIDKRLPDLPNELAKILAVENKTKNPEEQYLIIVIMHNNKDWIEVQGFCMDCCGSLKESLEIKRFLVQPIPGYF